MPRDTPPKQLTLHDLHDTIRKRLHDPSLNLSRFARDHQLHRTMLYEVRAPGSNPKITTLAQIADALDIRVQVIDP